MIILVSDLHLMDGTVGSRHLPAGAFDQTLIDLGRCTRDANAQDITMVFLGDVFDLITTKAWFSPEGSPQIRPWDNWRDALTEKKAEEVLQGILTQQDNQKIGSILSCKLAGGHYGFSAEPERVYIPGNHDRLCNLPKLRPMVRDFLGCTADPNNSPFRNAFEDRTHGIFARHGHEWDDWNFEGSQAFSHRGNAEPTYEEYMEPPIGDLLTIEVASRLPDLVDAALQADGSCEPEDREKAVERMWEVFDVKPLPAIIPWLVYQAEQHGPAIRRAIDSALKTIAGDLQQIRFAQDWLEKHDNHLNPADHASVLRLAEKLIAYQGLNHLDIELKVIERLSSLRRDDNHAGKAVEDLRRQNGEVRYIAYGHTHQPEQRALEVAQGNCDCAYLNTGTWRPVCQMGLSGRGFMRWNTLTYTIIYQPGETVSGGRKIDYPAFEVWSGSLKDF